MGRRSNDYPGTRCNGTKYTILKPGQGPAVAQGNTVTVHATGVVKETGKKFWSTKDPGQEPFTYQVGVGQVIKGWDQGLLGITVGEERQVVIRPTKATAPMAFRRGASLQEAH